MHSRLVELFGYVDQEHDDLNATVANIPPPDLVKVPSPDRWSIAQVLEHLVLTERSIARLLTRLFTDAVSNGLGPETDTRPILAAIDTRRITDRSVRNVSPDALRPPGKVDPIVALASLKETRAELGAAAAIGDGRALGEIIRPHPYLGPINGYEWIAFVGAHIARHHEQIRETARLVGRDVAPE